jgi:hypothetical protein
MIKVNATEVVIQAGELSGSGPVPRFHLIILLLVYSSIGRAGSC